MAIDQATYWIPNLCQCSATNGIKAEVISQDIADYGQCTSRNLKYFGYKLVVLSILDGLPIVYEQVPANWDERLAAEAVIDYLGNRQTFADKGFFRCWMASLHV